MKSIPSGGVIRRAFGVLVAGSLLATVAAPVAWAAAPILDGILDMTLVEGHVYNIPLHAEDADGDPIDLTTDATSFPALHAELFDNLDGTGTLRLQPDSTASTGSPYTITVTATAGGQSNNSIFVATVVNDSAPILDAILDQTMPEGTTRDIPIHAVDPDGDPITLTSNAGANPALHAVFTDNGDGTGNLHLAPDFTATAGSPYTISVFADSMSGTDQVIFDLTVTNVPQAPVVTVPADITTVATSAAGAVVTFTATATDVEDGDLTPVCVPASGSTFPVGITTVTCTATDSDKMTDSATFEVIVNDPDAPVISAPGGGALPDIKTTTTSSEGKPVSFTVVATDAIDGTVPVTCIPASGSLFPVGSTTVSCTATDQSGNTSADRFQVTVTLIPEVPMPDTDTLAGPSTGGAAPSWATILALLLATVGGTLVALRMAARRR